MRTSARTGLALAVAGAASGLTLLSGGAAALAAPSAPHGGPAATICRYEVTARSGLNVHKTPRGKLIPPPLKYRLHIGADCKSSHGGWVQLHQSVPKNQIGGWVFRQYLKPIKPSGGVSAGGGGTSAAVNPLLAGGGAGVIALGAGIAVAARRRQVRGTA
ncbi:hypothetical protein [Actinomadura opuntiae]|uniref:hypothetical protein n=1 Tax=Actinomadura sp. OS1-43 TaxID=604315 RepID=UPI00255AC9A9|nr:hypothetical protein [Actinomadura sp. OS1-43]MDL4816150.1 hypothetical protein [Actinomadura sp. OS1-43]